MTCLVEDDHCWTEVRWSQIHVAPTDSCSQLLREVLRVRCRRVTKKLKQVVVKSVRVTAVNHNVGHCKDLQQQSCSLVLIGRHPKESFAVDDDGISYRVKGRPNPHCAWRLLRWGWEDFLATEERVVECVWFTIARVAKYRHNLDEHIWITTKLLDELFIVCNLKREVGMSYIHICIDIYIKHADTWDRFTNSTLIC